MGSCSAGLRAKRTLPTYTPPLSCPWRRPARPSRSGRKSGRTGEEAACWGQGLTFDVAVQNPAGVQVLQPFQGLAQVVEGSVLRQTALLLYELAQRAT